MTDNDEARALVEACWQDLLDKDDRTSPEEYPEMCLITRDELADYISRQSGGGGVIYGAEEEREWKEANTASPPPGVVEAVEAEIEYLRAYASPEARDESIRRHPEKADYYHGKSKGLSEGLSCLFRLREALALTASSEG